MSSEIKYGRKIAGRIRSIASQKWILHQAWFRSITGHSSITEKNHEEMITKINNLSLMECHMVRRHLAETVLLYRKVLKRMSMKEEIHALHRKIKLVKDVLKHTISSN